MFANVHKRTIKDLDNINIADIGSGKGYYSQKGKTNKQLSICYHIRNSFAHALVEMHDNVFVIKDRNQNQKISAYFKIQCNDLTNTLNTIITESNLF